MPGTAAGRESEFALDPARRCRAITIRCTWLVLTNQLDQSRYRGRPQLILVRPVGHVDELLDRAVEVGDALRNDTPARAG